MIVAVVAVRLMQVATHQVVDVVAMWYRFVTTAWSVGMLFSMDAAGVVWGAGGRISATDGEAVLVEMSGMGVVEMPVV